MNNAHQLLQHQELRQQFCWRCTQRTERDHLAEEC